MSLDTLRRYYMEKCYIYGRHTKNNMGQDAFILHSETLSEKSFCVIQFCVIVSLRARRFRFTCRSTYRREKYRQRLLDTTSNSRNSRLLRALVISGWRRDVSRCSYKLERRTPCTMIVHSIRGASLTL